MLNITIPETALVVSGQHFAGWTWFTKDYSLRIVRYFYYTQDWENGIYQLVFFYREDNYAQFKDDLEFLGECKASEKIARELPSRSVNNNGGEYHLQQE